MTDAETKIYYLLCASSLLSTCRDKRVAAVSVYDGQIIGLSTNIPRECNALCNHTCNPIHAERSLNLWPGCTVYINLYPCENCQRWMKQHGVKKVVVFGEQHKDKVVDLDIECIPSVTETLKKFNGPDKQKIVAMGECAELVTALADSFRTDRENNYREAVGEMVDVLLQIVLVSDETFSTEWTKKIHKLQEKFNGKK